MNDTASPIDINELSNVGRSRKAHCTIGFTCVASLFIKAGRSLRFDAHEVIRSLRHCPILNLARQSKQARGPRNTSMCASLKCTVASSSSRSISHTGRAWRATPSSTSAPECTMCSCQAAGILRDLLIARYHTAQDRAVSATPRDCRVAGNDETRGRFAQTRVQHGSTVGTAPRHEPVRVVRFLPEYDLRFRTSSEEERQTACLLRTARSRDGDSWAQHRPALRRHPPPYLEGG